MKNILLLLLALLLNFSLMAQSNENYRLRNHKLNKKYHSKINSKKHRIANHKSVTMEDEFKGDKRVSSFPRTNTSNKLKVQNGHASKNVITRNKFNDQNPTFSGSNKKDGKRILNFFAIVLALSLIIAN